MGFFEKFFPFPYVALIIAGVSLASGFASGYAVGQWRAEAAASASLLKAAGDLQLCQKDNGELKSAINTQNEQMKSLAREASAAQAMALSAQEDAAKARQSADARASAIDQSKANTCLQAAEAVRGLL